MIQRLRTAVLVVHGMGSQRPLETVRGVINAVWFENDDHTIGTKKLWSHPEPSGVDLDLTVMTTNNIPGSKPSRVADFHELYWAHQMSETKAVAVLLWLFELGRSGPNLKQRCMNGLWWCGAIFLNLMLLSAALLAMKAFVFVGNAGDAPQDVVIVFFGMLFVGFVFAAIASLGARYFRLLIRLAIVIAAFVLAGVLGHALLDGSSDHAKTVAAYVFNVASAPVLALIASALLMGWWGVRVFALTYAASLGFFALFVWLDKSLSLSGVAARGELPWSLVEDWSVIAALSVIGLYLVINAWFLQPYLGDAARYFRNSPANVAVRRAIRKDAVNTLDQLHRSRDYDRIIVVAHSLGTVVAYDMLRAYYSRICDQIPINNFVNDADLQLVDRAKAGCDEMRAAGRRLIAKMAQDSAILADAARKGHYQPAASEDVDAWLVTDFVTLGSPLTHGQNFMVEGKNSRELDRRFDNSVREREFPTCPPQQLDGDGRITFKKRTTKNLCLHHGGVFGLTRWTNLFFPVVDIFWGDAIGGPLKNVFGRCIKDVPISTKVNGDTSFFTHTAYWKTDCADKRNAPHLAELVNAIDLGDTVA